MIHEGHYSVEKSLLRAREAVFWPRITQDITNEVQSCNTRFIKPNVPQLQPEEPETTLVSAQTTPVVRP